MFQPAMSVDQLRTEVVRILGMIKTGCDIGEAEEALQMALTCAYQAGQIEANNAHLARMTQKPK